MEIVIKIPEDDYINTKNAINSLIKYGVERNSMSQVCLAILDGTPLPKGHGDLIDRNSILCDDLPCNLCGHTDECFKLLAPTIIEADKEESEAGITREETKQVNTVLDKITNEINEYKGRKIFGFGVADLEKGKETALNYVLAIIDKYKVVDYRR